MRPAIVHEWGVYLAEGTCRSRLLHVGEYLDCLCFVVDYSGNAAMLCHLRIAAVAVVPLSDAVPFDPPQAAPGRAGTILR